MTSRIRVRGKRFIAAQKYKSAVNKERRFLTFESKSADSAGRS